MLLGPEGPLILAGHGRYRSMPVALLYPLALWGVVSGMVSPAIEEPAEDPTAQLRIVWDSPVGCSDEAGFRGRLRPLLAGAKAGPVRGDVEVRIVADGEAGSGAGAGAGAGWRMQLQITSGAAPWGRELKAPSCLQLVEVAALIAAITLDPLAASAALRVPSAPSSEGPAPGGPEEADEVAEVVDVGDGDGDVDVEKKPERGERTIVREMIDDEPVLPEDAPPEESERASAVVGSERPGARTRRNPRLGAALRAGLAGVYGPLPSFGLLVLGGVGLTLDSRAMVEVAVMHTFARTIPLAGVPGVGLEHRLTGARVSGCWIPSVRALELPLCAGVDVAALRVEALGLNRSQPATDLYIGGNAAARLMWRPVARFGVGLELGGMVTLRGREYTIAGLDDPIAQTAPVGGHGGLNLEVRLP